MRPCPNPKVEKYRERGNHGMGTNSSWGNNGVFKIPAPSGFILTCIVSDGGGWEHISVEAPGRCPTWDEMDWIKRLFWDDGEIVVQYHVSDRRKVNAHPYTLHLWRPTRKIIATPPKEFV